MPSQEAMAAALEIEKLWANFETEIPREAAVIDTHFAALREQRDALLAAMNKIAHGCGIPDQLLSLSGTEFQMKFTEWLQREARAALELCE